LGFLKKFLTWMALCGTLYAADAEPVMKTKMTNDAEDKVVDIVLDSGLNKIPVIATVNVVSTTAQGRDNNPDTWCRVDVAGAVGDTVTISIPDDSCTVVTTLTATEAADAIATTDLMVSDFNANGTCSALYKAKRVKDNPVMMVAALKIDGIAERPDAGDFNCDPTGTTTVTEGFDNIISREKLIRVIPDRDDPRVGATDVKGRVGVTETGRPPRRFFLKTSGGSQDFSIDGSGTPVVFKLSDDPNYDSTKRLTVVEVRMHANAGSIQLGAEKYIEVPELTNGVLLEIRSGCELAYTETFKLSEDIHQRFAFGAGSKFELILGSGDASLVAVLARPIIIEPTGVCGTDDDITATIRDDLSTSSISRYEMMIVGFFEDD